MMSQSTTSIFASPDVFVPKSGPALRRATPHSQLVVCDAAGEVLQSWNLILPKSTLGSASSNSICVSLPGIAPMHALLVSGQKQSFVRTLAGKLTQDGISASELLLSDEKNYFELAGYRFTWNRISAAKQQSERQAAQRMKFALSRPLSTSAPVEPLVRPDLPEEKNASAPWVADIIREAIEPLEAQIDSLLLPLAEFQAQALQSQATAAEAEEQRRKAAEAERKTKEQEIVRMVANQSATMETLTERFGDVNHQLSTIERIIAQDTETTSAASAETNKMVSMQQSAIEQLQSGMVSVSESLKLLRDRQQTVETENTSWKKEVQQQLQQLTSAVSNFSTIAENADQTALIDAIESLKQTHEVAQHEIQRWQSGVHDQLSVLQHKLDEAPQPESDKTSASITEALAEIRSKHEQSLAELHSWKSELKAELQQLMQTAAANVVAPPSVSAFAQNRTWEGVQEGAVAIAAGVQEVDLPNELVDTDESVEWSATNADQLENQTAKEIVEEFACAPFIDDRQPSFVAPELSGSDDDIQQFGLSSLCAHESSEEDEALQPEFIDEQAIEQAFNHETTADDQAHSEPVNSTIHSEDNAWPTLFVDGSEQFTENNLFAAPNWNAPAEDETPQTSEPVAEADEWSWSADEQPALEAQPEFQSSQPSEQLEFYHGVDETTPEPESTGWSFPSTTTANQTANESSPISAYADNDAGVNQWSESGDSLSAEFHEPKAQPNEPASPVANTSSRGLPSWWTEDPSEAAEDTATELNANAGPTTLLEPEPEFHAPEAAEHHEAPHKLNTRAEIDQLRSLLLDDEDDSTAEEPVAAAEDDELIGLGVELERQNRFLSASRGLGSDAPSKSEIDSDSSALQDHLAAVEDEFPNYQFPSTDDHDHDAVAAKAATEEGSGSAAAGEDDESVEDYMRGLLARMRGDSGVVPAPKPAETRREEPTRASLASAASVQTLDQPSEAAEEESFDLESYVPLSNAPEKGKNISALRDLANSTARTAIHKSTRRRTLSGGLMKFAISAIALTVAAALFAINGVAVNIALVATMAALFVAMIWGYDGVKSLKPLLQRSLVLKPGGEPAEEEPAEEA